MLNTLVTSHTLHAQTKQVWVTPCMHKQVWDGTYIVSFMKIHLIPYSLGLEPDVAHQTSWLKSTGEYDIAFCQRMDTGTLDSQPSHWQLQSASLVLVIL